MRYLRPDDAVTGDVLDAAAQLLPLGRAVAQPNAQAWLKPPARMRQLARRIADYAGFGVVEADRLCAATEELAERCVLDPVGDIGWRRPKVPELEALGLQGDPQAILAGRARAAIAWRYPDAPSGTRRAVEDRLEAELRVIAGFGFAGYFLTVADVADLIRGMGVRVQARGSGAGSLVNYLLRISSVDPLVHGLLFERFCGVARTTLPDIDLDVEAARRHDVDRAVVARYGEHRVALLAMQNRYRARGAARDAGLALGWDEERIGRLAGSLWRLNASDIRDALDDHPELAELSERIGGDPSLDLLVDLAGRLDRLPRHVSMHPCGVLLSDAGLLSLTPVQPSGAGVHMSQFDKDDIDDLGLLKLDILGVRMQSSLAYAHAEIVRVHGTRAALAGGLPPDAPYVAPDGRIDLDGLPRDDPATFTLIRSAHTLGVFQIESPGQRELVGKMQPDQFEDLIADISLFRPGPMKADMVNPFIERKLGLVPVRYPHPRLAPILAGTYGVVIYHEQVLRILHECMGVGLAQADELRRAMGDDMAAVEAAFRTRTAARRDEAGERVFSGADIDRIWTVLEGFGSFGFCKAHAAAFAWTTYQTAWLKAHYPAEFLAGILEHDPGMYPRRLLMTEARRLGVPLLPIDVNVSTDHYVVEQDVAGLGIRLSLRDVHGITGVEIRRILDRRPYHAISDFYLRAAPSRALVTRLAAIGALDSLALHEHGIVPCRDLDGPPRTAHTRGDVIAYVRRLVAAKHRPSAREDAPPLPVFVDDAPLMPSGTPDPTPLEQTAADLDATSAELHDHIIEGYRPLLEEVGVIPAAALLDLRSDTRVFVAGIRVATQTPPMKSGKRVVFLSLDDGSGVADCAFFTEAQARSGPVLFGVPLLLVQGRTRRTGARGISVQAEQAWDLKRMWADWSRRLAA
ncbi:MAG: DNA polymerase III subunit alpha [Actinomycetia bacterium]|nr:DNA polymerase III subunit alpha [Actinomycetes bacterium]